jgi:hypothetical protein
MTLKKIENFDGKDCSLWILLCTCVKFHENFLLNLVLLNLFVGIIEIRQGFPNQNNILLDYYIIHIALILQHNVRLGYKPSSITKFE